jgi:hypothetical protein
MTRKRVPYGELEIAGFDESVKAICGSSHAIVHHRETASYFVLSTDKVNAALADDKSLQSDALPAADPEGALPYDLMDEEEFKWLAAESRITILPQPLSAFPAAIAVYVKSELLDTINMPLPDNLKGEKLNWQELSNQTEQVWTTCASESTVDALMDQWGSMLLQQANSELEDYFSTQRGDVLMEAERLIQMAMFAARSLTLQYAVYVRHAVVIMFSNEQERLGDLCELIKPLFPYWNEGAFLRAAHSLAKSLQITGDVREYAAQVAYDRFTEQPVETDNFATMAEKELQVSQSLLTSSPLTSYPPTLAMSEEASRKVLNDILAISDIEDLHERMRKAKPLINACKKKLTPDTHRWIQQIVEEELKKDPESQLIPLPLGSVAALAVEPAIYNKGVLRAQDGNVKVHRIAFSGSATKYKENGFHPGVLAKMLTV